MQPVMYTIYKGRLGYLPNIKLLVPNSLAYFWEGQLQKWKESDAIDFRVVFQTLNTMDTGFYRCEASNGHTVTNGESMVKVHRSGSGSGRKKPDPKQDSDDDYDNDGSDPFGKHCFKSRGLYYKTFYSSNCFCIVIS
jgi:hypothetical protein